MILNKGLDKLVDALNGNVVTISYLVIGDSQNPISLEDIVLGNEKFRKPITSIYRVGESLVVETFIERNEANDFHWYELGLLTSAGELIARSLIDRDKNNLMTANVNWQINIKRG